MRKEDLRYTRTEDAIRQAFTDCVNTVGYTKTTVAMICRRAKINRKTFYGHYLDKEDLLDRLYDEMKKSIVNEISAYMASAANTSPEESYFGISSAIINGVITGREIFIVLYRCAAERLVDMFIEISLRNFRTMPGFYSVLERDTYIRLIIEYGAAGTVRLVYGWLSNYDSITPADVVKACDALWRSPTEDIMNRIKLYNSGIL